MTSNLNKYAQSFSERAYRFGKLAPALRRQLLYNVADQDTVGQRLVIPSSRNSMSGAEVYWYHSNEASGDNLQPGIIVLHGGGFVLGHALLVDRICMDISKRTQMPIVNIEYLKAPEHPYPEALLQIDEILEYIAERHDFFGIDPQRCFLMGFSAGANLAAASALRAQKNSNYHVAGQILHYPYLDATVPMAKKDPQGWGKDDETIGYFDELYTPNSDRRQSYISPVYAHEEELRGLAPVLCVTAELDVLRKEGSLYVKNLCKAGVKAEEYVMPEVDHAYVEQWAMLNINDELKGGGVLMSQQRLNDAAIKALSMSAQFIFDNMHA